MTDVIVSHAWGMSQRWRDMGDGTHAAVVAAEVVSPMPVPLAALQTQVVTLADADTEYEVEIPACQGFEFWARDGVSVRFAFEPGKVAAPVDPYRTLPSGAVYYEDGNFGAFALYLASSTPGTVVEIGLKI